MLRNDDFIITDSNYTERAFPGGVTMGCVPRDYERNPVGSYAGSTPMEAVTDMPLILMKDWPELIAMNVADGSQLSDIRNTGDNGNEIEALDQNGQGYCWFYSATALTMLLRAKNGLKHKRLSGHAGAWKIKGGRDQGGWGAQGLDFICQNGVPTIEHWPEKSMNGRQYDVASTWENAKLHRVLEGWIDHQAAQYDRNLSALQIGTCLLTRFPVILDYNWWGHSVCGMDLVDAYPNRSATDPRRYGIRILNSWRNSWGTRGTSVLLDGKTWPNGSVAGRSVVFSDN